MKFSTITPVINGTSATSTTLTASARMQTEAVSPEKMASNSSNQEVKKAIQKEIPKEKLKDAVQIANDFLKMVDVRFEYRVDEKTQKEVVEVFDQETGEKIKQFPPEEILNMLEKMYDMLGILVDDRI